jgi:hypothetical protein
MSSNPTDVEKFDGVARQSQISNSSKDEEKIENVEDVTKTQSQVQAHFSRFTKEEEEADIRKLDWHLMPLIFVLYSLGVLVLQFLQLEDNVVPS